MFLTLYYYCFSKDLAGGGTEKIKELQVATPSLKRFNKFTGQR